MKKVSARWVPRMLSDVQRQIELTHQRVSCIRSTKIPTTLFHDFNCIDETWLHHFIPERKVQGMAWKRVSLPPPRKCRIVTSAGKVMTTVFGDAEGTVLNMS